MVGTKEYGVMHDDRYEGKPLTHKVYRVVRTPKVSLLYGLVDKWFADDLGRLECDISTLEAR